MAVRDARDMLPGHAAPWAYDAGRRLALVTELAQDVFCPARPAPPPSASLVQAVLEAAGS
jgi:hypothetical protein